MIGDIGTVMWKEWKEIMTMWGSRGKMGMVVFVAVFGVFLPMQSGRTWVESPILLFICAWVPLMLVISVIADSVAGERERHTLETLLASRLSDQAILCGKAGAAVCYGVGISWISMLLGLVTVNIVYGKDGLLFFSAQVLLGIVVFSILNAGLAASGGILISLRSATVKQAQQTMSLGIMVLVFVPIIVMQAMPAQWRNIFYEIFKDWGKVSIFAFAALLLAAIDAGLFIWAMKKFRRARLILD
jgi:ABC-2 type transport system permease protein